MPEMSRRQRLIRALAGQKPDRLPATTHHLMPYFFDRYLGGTSVQGFLTCSAWTRSIGPIPKWRYQRTDD
jgi:hypothetical protein